MTRCHPVTSITDRPTGIIRKNGSGINTVSLRCSDCKFNGSHEILVLERLDQVSPGLCGFCKSDGLLVHARGEEDDRDIEILLYDPGGQDAIHFS